MLTPSNEILIFVEHHGGTNVHELTRWQKTSLRGALGKLEAQHYIERSNNGSIKITDTGIKYIDSKLDNLHVEPNKWDCSWQCVIFGIPESKRPVRDRLRRFLQASGYKNIFKTIWVKPLYTRETDAQTQISELKLEEYAFTVNFKSDEKLSKKLISVWPLTDIKKQYTNYIKHAKKAITEFTIKNDASTYCVKKTIFELADILSQEPNLPTSLMPADWPRDKALDLYKQLKSKLR